MSDQTLCVSKSVVIMSEIVFQKNEYIFCMLTYKSIAIDA